MTKEQTRNKNDKRISKTNKKGTSKMKNIVTEI